MNIKTDFFGIGNAIKTAIQIYRECARQTGRTTNLINSLKDGDRVIFTNVREAERVERLAKERGVKFSWSVVDPKNPQKIFATKSRSLMKTRIILDHSWVEDFYQNAIDKASDDIAYYETQASGILRKDYAGDPISAPDLEKFMQQ